MLIRSNTTGADDSTAALRSRTPSTNFAPVNSTLKTTTPNVTSTPTSSKPPQNRYESLFIKLFAHTAVQLILGFAAILLSMVIFRDIIGLKVNVFKFSFWFQFALNLALFVGLIFAKMKCINSKIRHYYPFFNFTRLDSKTNPLSNPFDYYFNQDQLLLIGIWTAAAFNFGSWYFRQYAPHIYKLFDHIKGKYSSTPVLREQYFLIWATLLAQGIVSWLTSLYFKPQSNTPKAPNVPLFAFLKSRVQDVTFWPHLLNKSAMVYVTLVVIHFACSWIAFPLFGLALSSVFDLHQPIRHSWLAIFRIGLFVHSLSFAIMSNLIYSITDWLIEFYLGRTFHTSVLVSDSEHLLTVGLCETKQNFIHLQACSEFLEIATETNGFRRYKLFTAVEDGGSLTREILAWFSQEMKQIQERSESSLQELNSFFSILGTNTELPNPELFKEYREKTFAVVELILKKIFTTKETVSTTTSSVPETNASGLPEIFARRGAPLNVPSEDAKDPAKKDSVPLIFEFGPLMKKNLLGKALIASWIASRKVHCIERFETLEIAIEAVGSFICASFVEDESGQVQLALPRVLETTVDVLKSLQKLLEIAVPEPEFENVGRANEQIEIISELLRGFLVKISDTFGETLESVRITSSCQEFIKSL